MRVDAVRGVSRMGGACATHVLWARLTENPPAMPPSHFFHQDKDTLRHFWRGKGALLTSAVVGLVTSVANETAVVQSDANRTFESC